MNRVESLELLEATNPFPGSFMIKAIGKSEGDFVSRVIQAVRQSLELEFDPPHSVRETAGARHVSVTIEPWCETAEDVLTVYDALKETDGLVLLL